MGHTAVNSTLHLSWKYPKGLCDCGEGVLTREYVLCHCTQYRESRETIRETLKTGDCE